MTFTNITLGRGTNYTWYSRHTCKSVVHSFSTRSFQIWNAMSNVINLNVSLFAFNCNYISINQTLFPNYNYCSLSLNVTLTTTFYDSILYYVVCIVLYCIP